MNKDKYNTFLTDYKRNSDDNINNNIKKSKNLVDNQTINIIKSENFFFILVYYLSAYYIFIYYV